MNKIYAMLGIAKKGGNISLGYDAAVNDIKRGKCILIVLACDASDKTKENIKYACGNQNVEYIEFGEKENLGKYLGRKTVGVLSITDKNIAAYIKNNK